MRFAAAAFAAFCLVLQTAAPSHAQDAWPSRNVTIIVPFTAG
nr:MFS transporter [Afipia sp.]